MSEKPKPRKEKGYWKPRGSYLRLDPKNYNLRVIRDSAGRIATYYCRDKYSWAPNDIKPPQADY